MNAEVNRRTFVASIAAGLPVIAGTAYGSAVASPQDPLFDHVAREVAAIHARGKMRGFTGEDARAIAAQLRTALVWGKHIGIDPPARKAVESLIRTRGRDAVLPLRSAAFDERVREKALDALDADGLTGMLTNAAGLFEKMASTLDELGPAARVRRVQFDFTWYSFCWPMFFDIQVLQAQATAICAAGSWYPGVEAACAGLQASVSVMWAMYYAFCL